MRADPSSKATGGLPKAGYLEPHRGCVVGQQAIHEEVKLARAGRRVVGWGYIDSHKLPVGWMPTSDGAPGGIDVRAGDEVLQIQIVEDQGKNIVRRPGSHSSARLEEAPREGGQALHIINFARPCYI